MERYETITPRFLALIIDSLVMIPIGILASAVGSYIADPKIELLSSSLINMVSVFYYILMHFRYGQTLGKMAMKVKVLDITEKPVTFTQAVIRSLPEMFPVFAGAGLVNSLAMPNPDHDFIEYIWIFITIISLVWHIADIIVCLYSEKKRALHDFIAGTVVVRTDGWSNLSINSK